MSSRLYRPFRTLFGSSRIASRLQSGQTVRIERVKIRKGKSATRFIGTVFKGALIFQLLLWAIPPAPAPQDGDGDRQLVEGKASLPAWFIAFPFTTKRQPPQPYSGSDPEWQEFIRIANNPKERRAIRSRLARIVLDSAMRHPAFVARLGKDIKIQQYWLDIDYPTRAPPVYERSGLLITDDAIAWATTTCDSWTVNVLNHFLWPKPLALGFWAFGTVAAKQTAHEIAKYFGFASDEFGSSQDTSQPKPSVPASTPSPPPLPSSPGPQIQKELQRMRQEATRRPEQVKDPGSLSSSAGATPADPSTSRDKAISAADKPAPDQGNQQTPEQKSSVEDLMRSFSNSEPWKKLKETFERTNRPPRPDPPRGSILVSGMVQLETPRAVVVFDVLAWYDPKTKSYAPGTVRITTRRWQPKQQLPLVK
ncbi:hypothetical protein N657DRAFT_561734 [Parathielavia appendiculata]|uniref:Uncharacterized protein n=1 Tax=Parathielavia appendiculata TaxID=2587402 RepID=A0AAN6UBX0_9PEZI|nr:hypothetical protein N657DRAFT_561734 [Parathielavia appendiculata]